MKEMCIINHKINDVSDYEQLISQILLIIIFF